MKKSSSETVLNHNYFNAKPPLRSKMGESDWSREVRLSRPRSSEHETKTTVMVAPAPGPMFSRQRQQTGAASLPTSPTAEASPFR